MLVRQLVKVEMSVSPAIIDFCEQLFDAFSQDLIEPLINLGLLVQKYYGLISTRSFALVFQLSFA
jgi:hypothetical protein